MFTGIVQNIGTIKKIIPVKAGLKLHISCSLSAKDLQKGTSVCVNGVCLTVEKYDKTEKTFIVMLVPETLVKSTFKNLKLGAKVNLEPSLKLGDSIAGHYVLGHTDGTARVISAPPELELEIPRTLLRFMPDKGSVAVNGVSLTIAKRKPGGIQIALIPTTLKETNLGGLKRNDFVNIEIDVIARYTAELKSKL